MRPEKSSGQGISPDERRALNAASIEANYSRGQIYAPLQFKAQESESGLSQPVLFKGFANTGKPDLGGDIVDPAAFTKSTLNEFLKFGRQLLFMHSAYTQVGEITEAEVVHSGKTSMFGIRDGGLMVRGFVDSPVDEELGIIPDHELAKVIHFVRMQVRRGRLKLLSIGWRPTETEFVKIKDPRFGGKERQFRRIKALILGEISLVTMAMSPQAMVEAYALKKAFAGMYGEEVSDALFCEGCSADDMGNAIPENLTDFDEKNIRRVIGDTIAATAKSFAVGKQPEPKGRTDGPKYKVVTLDPEQALDYNVVSINQEN